VRIAWQSVDSRAHRTIREAVRTKGLFELEHRVRRTDGTLGWTNSRAVPLLNDKKPEVADPTTFYEIAGYDLDKLHPCFEEEAKKRKFDWIPQPGDTPSPKNPCLIIYVGNEDRTKDVEFTAVTKNLATMIFSKSGLGNAKGIRFLLTDKLCPDADPGKGKPSDCFDDSRVEWDLSPPKPPANDVTASVSFCGFPIVAGSASREGMSPRSTRNR
jgi:hypothetical protein